MRKFVGCGACYLAEKNFAR